MAPDRKNKNLVGIYPHYKELLKAIEALNFHDHLCLIYETREEQFAAIVPFIRIGLERGEKCVYVADDNTSAEVLSHLAKGGIDTAGALGSGALSVITKREAYLKQGYFDPEWMIRFLKENTDAAKGHGHTGLRVTGEMTWIHGGDPGSERLIEYESKLNYFFPENDALAICQYNIRRFKPEIIRDVIRTHPLVIYRGQVCKNFYYVSPDEMLLPDQAYLEVGRLLYNIVERERLEELNMQAEDELAKKDREIDETQRVSQTGGWEWSSDTGDILWSDGTCRIFGIDPGMPAPDYAEHMKLYTPESAQNLDEAVKRAAKTGEPFELDLELASTGRWVIARGEVKRDATGRISGLRGAIIERTGRKRVETALQESEERFRSFAENADSVFWITSLGQEKIIYVNAAFERIWGIKTRELYLDPRLWIKSIHPEDMESVKTVYERWINGAGHEYKAEYRVIRPDGQVRWIYDRGVKIKDVKGGLARVAGIAEDITEQKLSLKEQQRTNEELQKALGKVKLLSGLLPICAYYKKIRNDEGYWEGLEKFIREHSDAEFTHCICPECAERLMLKNTGTD